MFCEESELAEYYVETDPVKRLKILDRSCSEESSKNQLRKKLFDKRYRNRRGEIKVDQYFAAFFELLDAGMGSRVNTFNAPSKLKEIFDMIGFSAAEEIGDEGLDVLYFELRNAAKRYLGTCRGDSYGSRFLGIMKPNADRQREKTAEDIWNMTRGVQKKTGACSTEDKKRLQLIVDAVTDEYKESEDDAAERFAACDRRKS